MKAIIEPGFISGIISAPPSKSMTQRACAAALLHKGETIVHHTGNSEDELAALNIIAQLGAKVVRRGAAITVHSNGVDPVSTLIHCGESGLSARLFTPIAALTSNTINVEGTGSLLHRPMNGVKEVLEELGVTLSQFNGYLPFTLQGPIQPKSITMNASEGSQFLSGLLFALSDAAKEPLTIEVTGLKSKPYIDMTLEVLALFGKPINNNNYRSFYIDPALFIHRDPVDVNIEADWSSAAYFLVAGAINGDITINNLKADSKQADNVILEILKTTGATLVIENNSITVKKSKLEAFEFDATDCPDLFPILAILAACCNGDSHILGVHRLFHKESNRVESITEMLGDFNVSFSVENDTLVVSGSDRLQGTVIDSYKDHRIVMAAAIGALMANGPVEISETTSVNKSYPGFFKDLIFCSGRCILV